MENLKLDDFTKYKFLSNISLSPNGKTTGFILHQMDLDENKYLSNIHIYCDQEKKTRPLTSLGEESNFLWQDDNTIIFPAIRGQRDQKRKAEKEEFTSFYEISLDGGEARKVFEIALNVQSLELIDEERLIVTAVFDFNYPNPSSLAESDREDLEKRREEDKDFQVVDEIPFWLNGLGFTNKKRKRLYLYNLKTKKLEPITDEFTNVNSLKLKSDRTKILLTASSYTDKMSLKSDLYLYNIEEKGLEKLNIMEDFTYSYSDFLGEDIVFIGRDMEAFGLNENPHIYLFNQEKKETKRISRDSFDYSLWNSIGSDCRFGFNKSFAVDGDYLYFLSTQGYNSYINRIDKKGSMERLTASRGSIDGFDVVDGNIKFIGLRDLRLQEIYQVNKEGEVQLTSYNQWVIEKKKLSRPDYICLRVDDLIIDGWLMKPLDFEKGKSYPGILNIHGGPKTSYGEVFFHEMQYWANQGYAVFFCNPRGSDGKGNQFADIRGKYGSIDYDDLIGFTDLVLKNYPFIDRDRLGVTGGSYGGFMTNWIIGHTNKFKAAVSQRSISNWLSFFGTTDIGYYFTDDQQAATPWSDMEKLWFHSPLRYADKVVTPTLFIHSEEDYRCWLPEAMQMFTALKYHGVESRLVMFKGENHELSRSGKPKSRLRRLEEMTKWFNKYLK